MLANRRRRTTELSVLPSLAVDIVVVADPARPIPATVDRLTSDTVMVTCTSGADALVVASSPSVELTFHTPARDVTVRARPGRRVDDVHTSRSVELVLDHAAAERMWGDFGPHGGESHHRF